MTNELEKLITFWQLADKVTFERHSKSMGIKRFPNDVIGHRNKIYLDGTKLKAEVVFLELVKDGKKIGLEIQYADIECKQTGISKMYLRTDALTIIQDI